MRTTKSIACLAPTSVSFGCVSYLLLFRTSTTSIPWYHTARPTNGSMEIVTGSRIPGWKDTMEWNSSERIAKATTFALSYFCIERFDSVLPSATFQPPLEDDDDLSNDSTLVHVE
uniref:Uncharacterized protein n=1 Tax=Grammatophora oceanica TaxID=210454 RepID=A0A7S1YB20_9STRA|mmetsp:Transcript_41210/g.61001  ORF Transcript_41210/g.61001 Transcript_41210/m.61001 type:complete len:115 (+) Transcript_41210:382-726(+)